MSSDTCLVVGAGIAGLHAARALDAAGISVILVDKARGVGGRLATHRLEVGAGDHGAQFFTAKDPDFRALMQLAQADGVVVPWSDGFPDGADHFPPERHLRYRAAPTMTALPKWLARNLTPRLGVKLTAVARSAAGWVATSEDGTRFGAGAVFLTAPVPQSLALLTAGGVALPDSESHRLQQVQYHPCFALLLRLDGPSCIPEPGALYPFRAAADEPIAWIADNRRKGISPAATVLTIHAGAQFSQARFAADPARVMEELVAAALPYLGAPIVESYLHRWRYAQTIAPLPEPYLRSASAAPLYLAGDGFGSRVEGAALSGARAAADFIARRGR